MDFSKHIDRLIDLALEEDIGSGDITTENLVDAQAKGRGLIVAKEDLVVAGLDLARRVFQRVDAVMELNSACTDGDTVHSGDTVAELSGRLATLLTGERVALNFLQRLSGIATLTRGYITRLAGKQVKLLDTRKTTPGWRQLEKWAVRVGGGTNHRMGLYDAILIKDNHIAAAGSISEAVKRVMAKVPSGTTIEVETVDLDQVREAMDAGAHIIMLDNMSTEEIKAAVSMVGGRSKLEVSGGITQERLAELADTGIDYISSGALTHSARAVDLSMRIIAR
jgi:nicotinate-nucleotide pyrophosphorylase (carboxylating)